MSMKRTRRVTIGKRILGEDLAEFTQKSEQPSHFLKEPKLIAQPLLSKELRKRTVLDNERKKLKSQMQDNMTILPSEFRVPQDQASNGVNELEYNINTPQYKNTMEFGQEFQRAKSNMFATNIASIGQNGHGAAIKSVERHKRTNYGAMVSNEKSGSKSKMRKPAFEAVTHGTA